MSKALAGVRVIDMTRVLAGPFCAKILRDLGAEIIKVEAPDGGDDARNFGPFLDGDKNKSAYFTSINCGKKSLSLNLKTEEGKDILSRLIKKSDVLIENYRPGVLERLGFSRERLRQLNPSLIYTAISGFGHSGPDKEKAAYDSIIQALSGIMSITGAENGPPVRVGSSIADLVSSLYAAIGILAGLYRLSKINKGAVVDVAMLDGTVSILENAIARYQVSGESPRPLGSRHPSITPFESFKTKDSEIIIAAGNNKLFALLCQAIAQPQLTEEEKFTTNARRTANFKDLRRVINSSLRKRSSDYWLRKLAELNIPCAKINAIEDIFKSRQLKERNMLLPLEQENDFKIVGNPIKFSGEPEEHPAKKPPVLGEHNQEILEEILGYSKKQIMTFHQKDVLG